MLNERTAKRLDAELGEIRASGVWKDERVIESAQGAEITVGGRKALNFCANNYLGLSSHPELVAAAHRTLDVRGYGMSSVRFICGTQDLHRELEKRLSAFLGTDDTILYTSCFDANGGVFETLLGPHALRDDGSEHQSRHSDGAGKSLQIKQRCICSEYRESADPL